MASRKNPAQDNPAAETEKAPPKREQAQAPVTAAEQRDEREGNAEGDNLDQQVKEQEAQQKEELGSGKVSGAAKKAADVQPGAGDSKATPAGARAGHHARADTQGGFMDQMSARSAQDAFEGHFVNIDLNNKDVQKAYESVRGLDGHTGAYGVYVEPQLRDSETGIPLTAAVRLRDETNALVVVPYDALTRADARGR
jgi:hypothetical protein